MSSTNKTPNLNLHSWVRTDPVLCADFNENFTKLDAAVGALQSASGNCVLETGSYIGDGELSKTMSFDTLPDLLYICNAGFLPDSLMILPKAPAAQAPSGSSVTITRAGNSVTWQHREYASRACNTNGVTYYYLTLRQK